MSLKNITTYIGIDVSKHWFHVYILRAVYNSVAFQCENTEDGVKEFLKKLKFHRVSISQNTIVTIEHTGLYTYLLVDVLSKERMHLVVEMAVRIRKGLGITRGKKDEIDCKRIAEYTMRHLDQLFLYVRKPKNVERIKRLLQNRSRFLRAKGMLLNPLKETKYSLAVEQKFYAEINRNVLQSLDKAVENVLTQIGEILTADKRIARQYELLISVPGIGSLTALAFIAHTNCFDNCDSVRQLSSYCGVAPFEISSGVAIVRAHTSKMSNRILKSHLYLAALGQVRSHNELRDYYERKVLEGKPKGLVLNNVSNKIVHRVWSVIKRDTPYIPNAMHRRKYLAVEGLS